MAKAKKEKVDGLGADDIKRIRQALRQVWYRSFPHKLAQKRSTDSEGYRFCEKCKRRSPKVHVDHIETVGDIVNGGVERMFVASAQLQVLCPECHKPKTKQDNAKTKRKRSKGPDLF